MNEKFPYGFLVGVVAASAIAIITWPSLSQANKRWHVEIMDTNPASFPPVVLTTNRFREITNGPTLLDSIAAIRKLHPEWLTNLTDASGGVAVYDADDKIVQWIANSNLTATVKPVRENDLYLGSMSNRPAKHLEFLRDTAGPGWQGQVGSLAQTNTNRVTSVVLPFEHAVHAVTNGDSVWLEDSVTGKPADYFSIKPSTNLYKWPTNVTRYNGQAVQSVIVQTMTNDYIGHHTGDAYLLPTGSYLIPGPVDSSPVWMPFPKFQVHQTIYQGKSPSTFEFIFESEIEPVVTKITNVYGALRWEVRLK